MAETATIETKQLFIEPFSESHLHLRYVNWLNDPEVVRFSQQSQHKHTLESCRKYWLSFQGTPNFFWAIVSKDPNLGHIGNMNAYLDQAKMQANLGILIGERGSWGLGFGSEAWRAVCDYLFRSLNMRLITAGTLSVNQAMLGIMKKTGMQEYGSRSRHSVLNGKPVDVVEAKRSREDWLKEQA
jgi:[ribosomal protein S5]-alanine N-acetyltransferase